MHATVEIRKFATIAVGAQSAENCKKIDVRNSNFELEASTKCAKCSNLNFSRGFGLGFKFFNATKSYGVHIHTYLAHIKTTGKKDGETVQLHAKF